jgi:hypothetical protein
MKNVVLSVAGALLIFSAGPKIAAATSPLTSFQQQSEQTEKVFSGTIIKSGDEFMLSDAANKLSYVLDNAEKARQYEGKKVKVTGTVNIASNTIHVESIQEIA